MWSGKKGSTDVQADVVLCKKVCQIRERGGGRSIFDGRSDKSAVGNATGNAHFMVGGFAIFLDEPVLVIVLDGDGIVIGFDLKGEKVGSTNQLRLAASLWVQYLYAEGGSFGQDGFHSDATAQAKLDLARISVAVNLSSGYAHDGSGLESPLGRRKRCKKKDDECKE